MMMPLAATECLLNSRSVSFSSSQHALAKDTHSSYKDPWDALAMEYVDGLMTSCFSTKDNYIVFKPMEAYEEEQNLLGK